MQNYRQPSSLDATIGNSVAVTVYDTPSCETQSTLLSEHAPQNAPEAVRKMDVGLKPGSPAPRRGRYQQRGRDGIIGRIVTAMAGQPLPATPKKGMRYHYLDLEGSAKNAVANVMEADS